MKKYPLLLCGIGLAACLMAQSKTAQKILATEQLRFERMTQRDTQALRPMLADDLVYIHSNAMTEDKKQHLEAIGSGKLVYRSMSREQAQVRRYGKIALTNGIAKVKGELDGAAFEVRLRYTATYRKKGGKWRLLNWQSTRVP